MFTRTLGAAAIALLVTACEPPITMPPTVEIGGGSTGSAETNVRISPALPAPGVMVTFDSGELAGAGDRTWSFGDGGSATGVIVGHTFDTEGVYQITLVRDDGIGTYEHTFRLVVDDPTRQPDVTVPQSRIDR